MRRKYDLRNKKSFVVILLLAIAVVCIFSLFIYKYKSVSKIEYKIESGSIVQDTNKNFIEVDDDAVLKIRWNDTYYLIYQEKKINLDKRVIVYNTITGGMQLYGTFYEIQEDGKIVDINDETILSNTTDTKFYKLADREYLLVDRTIVNEDKSINTTGYLLVELDKQGNAKLSNNNLQLKTISPTILLTSKYKFDIANEILNYGKYDINLKKIIGSSNQYVAEATDNSDDDTTDENSTGTGSGSGNGTGSGTGDGSGDGTGSGTGTGEGTGTGTGTGNGYSGGSGNVINSTDTGDITDIGEIKNKTKMTSIVRVSEGLTQIDIDYVIYDPYNEYKSVYAEVNKNGSIDVVYLSKNDTHLVIDNLSPDTEYRINFIYTTSDSETKEIKINTFDQMTLTTKKPEYSISVYKFSNVSNKLTYKVGLQDGYNTSSVKVNLSFKYNDINPDDNSVVVKNANLTSDLDTNGVSGTVMGTFDISGYDIENDTILKLTVVSVTGSSGTININTSYSFRFGR